jgi:hypothetical protein
VERGGFDPRRASGFDRRQQSPSLELQNAGTHQRQRRKGMGPALSLLDHEHVEPGSRQEHRRRRAGAACADDDRIVRRSQFVDRVIHRTTTHSKNGDQARVQSALISTAVPLVRTSNTAERAFA